MTLNRLVLIAFVCYTSAHQIPRDDNGRIARDKAVIKLFKQQTGYPNGRKGFEVDHIVPLRQGGCDTPENMQWLERDEHRLKSIREKSL